MTPGQRNALRFAALLDELIEFAASNPFMGHRVSGRALLQVRNAFARRAYRTKGVLR